jgi:hypothetical protein
MNIPKAQPEKVPIYKALVNSLLEEKISIKHLLTKSIITNKIQTTNYKLQTTNYKLQTTNYKLQTINYKIQNTKYKIQTTKYNVQQLNYKFLNFSQ